MKDKYDVIIIGAGIGGLIAGAYLAKHGIKVLIAEKNSSVGGCCSSFKRGNFNFDAGAQVIGSCGSLSGLGSILNTLKIKVDFIQLDPTDIIHYPGETVAINSDFRKFKSYLEDRFKKEKGNIENFFNFLADASDRTRMPFIMDKYAFWNYQSFLDSFFKDEIIKSILSAQCGYLGLSPKQLSAVAAIFLLKTYIIEGAYYPKGGSQILSGAIAKTFVAFGGTLLLNSEVGKILIKDNGVQGVSMKGVKALSNFVISASDATMTYRKLVGQILFEKDIEFCRKFAEFKPGDSGCILYAGISKKMDLQGKHGWYYPSYDINEDFKKVIYVHIPTNYDRSVSKNGDNILIASRHFDYTQDKKTGREKFKDELKKKFLLKLKKHFPDIEKNIILSDIATPLTVEKYTFNLRGTFYGWAQSPSQAYKNSFSISSPIRNLFHAGHWTFPGGGVVAVAVSGINVARRVLKRCKKVAV